MKKIIGIILIIIAVVVVTQLLPKNESEEILPRNELQNDVLYEGELNQVEDGTYEVVTTASVLNWKGQTITKSHSGTLAISEGRLEALNGTITGSIVINMDSLVSDGEGITNDLKSDNFFDTETYPTARFDITNYSQGALQGELTIKNISQPVSLPVTITTNINQLLINGMVTIDRTLWGIEYRSNSVFSDLGDKAIDDNLEIDVMIVAEGNYDISE